MQLRWIAGSLLAASILVSCGAATSGQVSSPTTIPVPTDVLSITTIPTADNISPTPAAPTTGNVSPTPGSSNSATKGGGLATRQLQVVIDYFSALADQQPADAWALLTPEMQAQTSESALAKEAQNLQDMAITIVTPVQVTDNRAIYQITLHIPAKPNATTSWNAGDNIRWINVMNTPQGWKIAQIASSPIPAGPTATTGA